MKDLKAFENWQEKVRIDQSEQLPFVWEIMRSPFVAYHYSLMKDKSFSEEFRQSLMFRFDEYHEAGRTLLLSKLE